MKVLGNNQIQQIIQYVSCYLASLSGFLPKTAKTSQYTHCLHSLFTQFWDPIFHPFEVLRLAKLSDSPFDELPESTFAYSDLLHLLLHLVFCKAHQNCLIALF